MNIFQSLRAMLIYRKAVRMANEKHRETGRRYFVMPNVDTKIFLIVTDRKNFRRIRQKRYIDASMKLEDVFKKCFYYTPQANGEGRNITEEELKAKQVAYQLWYQERLKRIPAEKKALRKKIAESNRRHKKLVDDYKRRKKDYEQKIAEQESKAYDYRIKKYRRRKR